MSLHTDIEKEITENLLSEMTRPKTRASESEQTSRDAGKTEYPDPEDVGGTGGPAPPGPYRIYNNMSHDDLVLINQNLSAELQRVLLEVADYENRSEKESNIIKAIANLSRSNDELRTEVDKLVGGVNSYVNESRDREKKIEEREMGRAASTRLPPPEGIIPEFQNTHDPENFVHVEVFLRSLEAALPQKNGAMRRE